ncbi:MAG TPA: ATP-binding protein [Bacteroidales bacterium]|nr:ATP-binding protein [Bacteroidales bacterium]
MIKRIASKRLKHLFSMFKVVAVTGPRQSGKTTLVKSVFPDKPYITLENPDNRQFAIDDPRGFLNQFSTGAILDEIQRTPLLFSYLQEIVDNNAQPGQFILTGSNNFLLNEQITQSLAGRVGYLNLFPFSLKEITAYNLSYNENDFILNGFYPPVYDQKIEIREWIPGYIRTYIERDVRQLKNISDLLIFEKFMRLLAGRTGQEVNYTSLSVEVGVDVKTIQSWLSVLVSSYIVFLLPPFYKNYNKTIVKRPKLYFYDTALASSLLGIRKIEHLTLHPLKGSLFECLVVSELIKQKNNLGINDSLYFWRDKTGREIDLIIDKTNHFIPVEIKSGKTVHNEFFRHLRYWLKLTGEKNGKIIYAGDDNQKRSEGIEIISWKSLPEFDSFV